jgi:hypothetical protein
MKITLTIFTIYLAITIMVLSAIDHIAKSAETPKDKDPARILFEQAITKITDEGVECVVGSENGEPVIFCNEEGTTHYMGNPYEKAFEV